METNTNEELARDRMHHEVLVIGAGQAGLAVAHYLAKAGIDVLIVEAGARIGDSWRRRWDSLRLFTAAEFAGLPDYPFPGDPNAFPTKDQLADYLEAYASRMGLRVRFHTRIDALERAGDRYVARAGDSTFESRHVIVTTGPYQQQRLPEWAATLDERIVQIHSGQYKNPGQLPRGDVLVVGAGNTGAELALEAAAAGHRVLLSGRDVGQVPRLMRLGNGRPFWFLATRVFTVGTPIGRKIRTSMEAGHSGPLVRIRRRELTDARIERVGRVTGVRDGRPQLEDGRDLDVACVLWCAGFRMDFSWIRLPIFGAGGYPRHEQGRVTSEPGLYFVGLPFQRNLVSSTLVGVGRDAEVVARRIVDGLQRRAATPAAALTPAHT
jgi:putative flavoprotein involved in K+ transport